MATLYNEAHTALVKAALEELAIQGYTAWQVNTGATKTDSGGFVKFGKTGAADISAILPIEWHGKIFGVHAEFEAKTGKGVQKKNQKLHQQFVVERNGGLYILFYSVAELMEKLERWRSAVVAK